MKNKSKKKYGILIVGGIVIVIIVGICITTLGANSDTSTSSSSTQIVTAAVSTQTIQNKLTSSGQVATSSTEKLSLSTSKYFSTMCVEEGDSVKKSGNILKYSNGTYLTAPYDCIVSSYTVPESGSICTSSNNVQIQNLETLQMTLNIDESQINRVAVGQSVEVVLSAFEDKTYEGTITKINAIGTYATSGSTFTATVQFANDQNAKIGMSASCSIILEEATDCIAVPIEAVQTKGDTKYVIVVKEDNTTEDVTVETGISNDSYVQILSGLEANQTIQMLKTTSSSGIRKASSGSSSSSSGFGSMGGTSMEQGGMQPGGTRGQ